MQPFLQTGPEPYRRRPYATPYARGLLSDEFWGTDEDLRVEPKSSPRPAKKKDETDDGESKFLPDSVIRLYSDLDDESRSFLRFGPRGAHERLAYAQGVHPRAHASARLALAREQRVFEERNVFDADRTFIGPNGRVYLRDENSSESLGARIRRGYERAVGDLVKPSVVQSLKEIREATRSKRADVQNAWPQPSPQEEQRRAFLRQQRINPSTWTLADPLDDVAQKTFRESGQLWPAIEPFAFVGPNGVVYRRNDMVREDPLSQYRRVREWQEARRKSADSPPPDPWEIYWQAVAAGGTLPGPINGSTVSPRLSSQSRPVQPEPSPTPEPPLRGRLGTARTRALNEQIARSLESLGWERYFGSLRTDGKQRREEWIPGPLADFELDGRPGSLYPDISFRIPDRRFARINTTTVDPRTGKPTIDELDAMLRIFKRIRGDVYGISKE